jgi:hypothetical protein
VYVFHDTPEEIFGVVLTVAAKPGRKQEQQRSEPFAAGAEDIFADLLDERNVGAQALMDPVLHALHIGLVLF